MMITIYSPPTMFYFYQVLLLQTVICAATGMAYLVAEKSKCSSYDDVSP